MKIKTSTKIKTSILFAAIFSGLSGTGYAEEPQKNNVNGRFQIEGTAEKLNNHGWSDDKRAAIFLKQAHLNLNGVKKQVDYEFELMFGGEEVPKSNSIMSLLDAYINIPFVKDTFEVKVGQFKVPYSRERLTGDGVMSTTNRSIQNNFFNLGYDVGAAVHSKKGIFTGAVGLFTGGGANIPERYIPERLAVPMTVARVGINNGMDKSIFTPKQTEETKKIKYAAYVNSMYTKNSRVGHSTPLDVKYMDKSLMVNSNWNPYMTTGVKPQATFTQNGVDAAVQIPINNKVAVQLSAEANTALFINNANHIRVDGNVTDASVLLTDWELGLRYSSVVPDEKMAYTQTTAATATKPATTNTFSITRGEIKEITPHYTYNLKKFGIKLIGEYSLQKNVPIAVEKGHGVYNLMLMPDSNSYIANVDGKEYQDVQVARAILQYEF